MKSKLITISATLMIGIGSLVSVPKANAESIDDQRSKVQTEIKKAQSEISSLQEQRKKIEEQLRNIKEAIQENNEKINETNEKIEEIQAKIDLLNNEISDIQERIDTRNEILKERAVSFQENGGQIRYLEVILGSSSFSDFISRVDAVAQIVEADNDILDQHKADKTQLEAKQEKVTKELADLTGLKVELQGMQQHIQGQKAQSEQLRQQLIDQENASEEELASLQIKNAKLKAAAAKALEAATKSVQAASDASEQGSVPVTSSNTVAATISSPSEIVSGGLSTVIQAGYKYIGNSVYVFGGGRTASDVANGRFDCSGFVAWAFGQGGYNVGASTEVLKNTGTRVSVSDMQPGDMVFFNTYKTDGHVGIYLGNGKFIGSQSSTGVAVADMTSGYWADTFNGRVMRVAN